MALTLPPRATLGTFPTPLHEAPVLGNVLDVPHLWLKRDDLTGFAWGGNKVRAAEFLIADATRRGTTDLIASGGPTSNFTATLAVAAGTAGISFHQVSYGDDPDPPPPALVAGRSAGALVTFSGSSDRSTMEQVADDIAADLARAGRRPATVPRGGANLVGANGFVAAAVELDDQLVALGLTSATIVIPVGSGGSIAGLLAGRTALGRRWPIVGASVSRSPDDLEADLLAKAGEAAVACDPGGNRDSLTHGLELHDCRGKGFGIATASESELAARIMAATGLLTDPTYNAKALLWLAHSSLAGSPEHPIVYWHTGGLLSTLPGSSTPGLERHP